MSTRKRPNSPPDTKKIAVKQGSRSDRPSPRLILSVVVLVLLAGGAAYLAFGGRGGTTAASGQHPAGMAATVAPNSTRQVVPPGGETGSEALSALGSNALTLPATKENAVKKWRAGHGGADLSAVSQQVGAVTQAAGIKQYVSMRAGCATLAADVRTAQHGPRIPDAAMQKLYAASLVELAAGTTKCHAAISEQASGDEFIRTTVNKAELHTAMAEFATGARELYRATAEIEAAGSK